MLYIVNSNSVITINKYTGQLVTDLHIKFDTVINGIRVLRKGARPRGFVNNLYPRINVQSRDSVTGGWGLDRPRGFVNNEYPRIDVQSRGSFTWGMWDRPRGFVINLYPRINVQSRGSVTRGWGIVREGLLSICIPESMCSPGAPSRGGSSDRIC